MASLAPLAPLTATAVPADYTALPPSVPRRHRITITGRMSAKIYSGELCATAASPDARTRPVVVKAVRIAAPANDADSTAALDDADPWCEWRVTKRLQALSGHANVVELLETYANKQHVFFVMERCNSGDLLQLLTAQPASRLPQVQALDWFLQVARGVAYLHAHNIAHRDLSLENVFVHDGVCKIGDFGLSAFACADHRARDCVGKTQYVAPEAVAVASESIAGASSYDLVTADIWSLGVILFMLLTGAPLVDFASPLSAEFQAFCAAGVRGVLHAWQMQDVLSVATLDLLTQLLQVDPSKRFQSVVDVLAHPSLLTAARRAAVASSRSSGVL